MKKNILIVILILSIFIKGYAQINLSLAFNSRPQPYLADWSNSVNGRAIVTVGQASGNVAVKFKSIIINQDGVVVGSGNLQTATVYTLNRLPATNLFSLGEVLQLQNMQFNAATQNLLQHSGRLQAGTYTFTVQIFNSRDSLLAERLAVLNINGYQLPVLISPANNTELDAYVASSIITFRWTRLTPVLQELPRYRVQVFEILNSQTPMQALRSNTPLLDEEAIKGTTQFIWHSNLPMLDTNSNRQFIWTVQSLDFTGNPIPTNDINVQGRSEPAIFKIINQPASKESTAKKQLEEKPKN